MPVELETMAVGTSVSGFDRLTCITLTISQEGLEKLHKITIYLFESIRELSKEVGIKIPERRDVLRCAQHSVLQFPLRHLPM